MRHRAGLLLLTVVLASPVRAGWYPFFDTTEVRVEVGETKSVRVRPTWSGWWVIPWQNWTLTSADPAVAHVDTVVFNSNWHDVPVTGVAPGRTGLRISGFQGTYTTVEVVCGTEGAVANATPELTVKLGESATMRVVTPIAHRTAFSWYRGPLGDTTQPLAGTSGPEAEVTPAQRGTEHFWVRATTPCSTSTAGFIVHAFASRQRVARH